MNDFYQLPNGKTTAFYLGHRGTVEAIERSRRNREMLAGLIVQDDTAEEG